MSILIENNLIKDNVISGKNFNEKYNCKFYKITNETEIHHSFQYKDGLNIDILHFNPTSKCSAGGLYFADINNIFNFLDFGIYIRVATSRLKLDIS